MEGREIKPAAQAQLYSLLLDLGRNRPRGYGEAMGDTGVRLLAECPYLRNVTELRGSARSISSAVRAWLEFTDRWQLRSDGLPQ